MKTYINPKPATWPTLCKRPIADEKQLDDVIAKVFDAVGRNGDKALVSYTEKFDGVTLSNLCVTDVELATWADATPWQLKEAINQAYANIYMFHKKQRDSMTEISVETMPGVRCWRRFGPIENIGLYVPGGSAPLISTVLMLGVPAQIAGCDQVVLCTPPRQDGSIDPAICYAAQLVGVSKLVRVGGAQAIAALSLGTDSVPRVDKIVGPGNQYVTAAKMFAQRRGVAIDMPAGPSEVMVVADCSAKPEFVAADLLSQAEHGADSQVVLLATEESILDAVKKQITQQLAELPRQKIAAKALEKSFMVVCDSLSAALSFANEYAPEHLILSIKNPKSYLSKIRNAGSVFLGNYSPESIGDYASGTNHTLPTNGYARNYSGLSVDSFCKSTTFQELTPGGLAGIADTVLTLAAAEGLQAHARAVSIRCNDDKPKV